MTIDRTGNVVKHKISESVIDIDTRFCYDDVQKILDGDVTLCKIHKHVVPMLRDMAELTVILEAKRRKRGEVIFEVPEPKIVLDPKTGKICDVIAYPHWLAHRIVESFMIQCNETVAQYFSERDIPFIYRIHEKPDPVKAARFVEMLKPFAVYSSINPQNPTGLQYQAMIDGLDESIKPIISQLSLRSMQKARYSPQCIGHFGLGAKYYCHFTSPIRRYPDLAIHRIIKLMLNKNLSSHKINELEDFVRIASDQSSKTELAATEAEREVDNLKRAEYMSDQIGEKFSGVISGITEYGVYVYLPNTVEGLVKIDSLPKDSYTFNERNYTLVGRRRTYKMGDKIDVICVGVNMPHRQVEFGCVNA